MNSETAHESVVSGSAYPLSRNQDENLLSLPVGDELVVYDLERHKASCLNETAAQVWQWCDGATTPR